ncbi:hypothetical protein LCGC14_1417970 [marine sediment metagenome]
MGMPFSGVDNFQPQSLYEQGRPDRRKPEHLSIRIETDSLIRLLKTRQLHVQNFSCADPTSKTVIYHLLLEFALNY